jgi:hypothetical protein
MQPRLAEIVRAKRLVSVDVTREMTSIAPTVEGAAKK